jgi:hypothetical protein
MKAHKFLSADGLFALMHAEFEQVSDQRAENAKIPLVDALMSGFAMVGSSPKKLYHLRLCLL